MLKLVTDRHFWLFRCDSCDVCPGADVARLTHDLEAFGFLLEFAVVHDLLVYAEAVGGRVHRYRDSNGHLIDAVIPMPDGSWAAVEVKLVGGRVPAGAARLSQAVAQKRPAAT
ncbi:DUF4143 domain-containing protein [Actinomyces succiniciruminis]|uniref:DUF4143 domain-containing protein n=1 Tax=Actinomyces succiniciruminis TaxID=1522002 RepID=A0A1L7RNM3_9ACTO|nr:DUF4143 domain-containing protein [Actinomyces succiniciruminis]CED91242.1 Hypothetical protein AAM4_1410 [Actinomyces succiniciruminis]